MTDYPPLEPSLGKPEKGAKPKLIILLGSYDVKTLNLMKHVKESILEKFGDEDIYCILLEDVDVYLTDKVEVLTERWAGKITLWVFRGTTLVDLVDVKVGETIENFLRANYQTTIVRKVPIFEKLRLLATVGWLLLVLRHQELTRGGEWVELHCAGLCQENVSSEERGYSSFHNG